MGAEAPPRRVRVVLAGVGASGESRGVQAVARALRDAGHEVVYAGPCQAPATVVDAAPREDAPVIGLSPRSPLRAVAEELEGCGASDIPVFGGNRPDEFVEWLREVDLP